MTIHSKRTWETRHLEELVEIVEEFIKRYKFNRNYLKLSGSVTWNVCSSIDIECHNDFDTLTVGEVKGIEIYLYNKLCKYLQENNITNTLYIESSSGISLFFKEELTIL